MSEQSNPDLELALAYCADVTVAVDSILTHVGLKEGDQLGLLLLAKSLRARLFFLSIIELARKRYAAPTSALVRCLMEVQYVVEALGKNISWMSDLIAADQRQRKRAMQQLLKLPPEDRAANVQNDRINAALATIDTSASVVTVSEWAIRAGRHQEYKLAYMLLSSEVHASLRGAETHLLLNDSGGLRGLTAMPEAQELPFRLMCACDSMLAILWVLPEGLVNAEARSRIEALASDDRKLDINGRALAAVEAIPADQISPHQQAAV